MKMENEKRLVYAEDAKEALLGWETDPTDEEIEYTIDELPTVDAIPLTADELRYLINDTIAYIWRLEKRGCDKSEFGYDRRKALLEKLKQFQKEHFPEKVCSG